MDAIISISVLLIIVYSMHEKFGFKGSIGCLACFFGLPILFAVIVIGRLEWDRFRASRETREAQEAEATRIIEIKRQQEARIAEEKRIQEAKDEKIRSFALKEAPNVWAVYQSLQSEIDVQNDKIEGLRTTLEMFGKVADQDMDFQRICTLRDDMIRSHKTLRIKLEDAYIASRKYEASPSRKDYQELLKKALEDGMLEADAAEAKFKEMRVNK